MSPLAAQTKAGKKVILYLVICQVLDFLFTWWGCSNFGPYIEANLLIRWLMSEYGILTGLLLVKVPGVAILYFIRNQINTKLVFNFALFVAGLYTIVVLMWVYAHTFI